MFIELGHISLSYANMKYKLIFYLFLRYVSCEFCLYAFDTTIFPCFFVFSHNFWENNFMIGILPLKMVFNFKTGTNIIVQNDAYHTQVFDDDGNSKVRTDRYLVKL